MTIYEAKIQQGFFYGRLVVERVASAQIIRYFFVSLVALAMDAGALFALVHIATVSASKATALAFCLGAYINYSLSVKLVFSERRLKDQQLIEIISFILIGILGLLITESIIYIVFTQMDYRLEIAKFLAAGITFFFNFFVRKIVLFNSEKPILIRESQYE